jgi:hypothetical protein
MAEDEGVETDLKEFSMSAFLGASVDERNELCRMLESTILTRLDGSHALHDVIANVVKELRLLGHDLWSLDEDKDLEVWCPDWVNPKGPGIAVEFRPTRVTVVWQDGLNVVPNQ